jgi:hypothetical protein
MYESLLFWRTWHESEKHRSPEYLPNWQLGEWSRTQKKIGRKTTDAELRGNRDI